MDTVSTDIPEILRLLLALILVLGLMGGLALALKKLGLADFQTGKISANKRLSVVETLPLDARRRIAIIRRDDTEHLVILSATGETVIETNIIPPPETESVDGKAKFKNRA